MTFGSTNSPEDKEEILRKVRASQARVRLRLIERQNNPVEQEKRREKSIEQQAAAQARLRAKMATPEYQAKQRVKAKLAADRAYAKKLIGLKKAMSPRPRAEFSHKSRKKIKSRGMLGRARTVAEKRLESKIVQLGCICCLNMGWYSSVDQATEGEKYICPHHIDGRTKPWCHAKQLPLCQYHHDTPPPPGADERLFPLHGSGKKRWVKVNGTEKTLLEQVYCMIGEDMPWLAVLD